jgi:membrane peptidoglycan carboxypeptidase
VLVRIAPRIAWKFGIVLVCAALAVLTVGELRHSRGQSRYLSARARAFTFQLEDGPSKSIHFPEPAPYDNRMGYSSIPTFVGLLTARGFEVEAQAGLSPDLLRYARWGFFPPYLEKSQAGLEILDFRGETIFSSRYPGHVYTRFESIPGLIVDTLLFIENREVLDFRHPYRNPAVEWDRLAKATLDATWSLVDRGHNVAGGSTLATQLEKFRHSPEGRTSDAREKLRQLTSASFRSYLEGEDTREARRRIVLDYINSVPLAAMPGHGEVTGLGDGLRVWFGQDLESVNHLLSAPGEVLSEEGEEARGLAFKQVLSLFLAQRRPSYYLLQDPVALGRLANTHLEMLCEAGVIPLRLRNASMKAEPRLFKRAVPVTQTPFYERKAQNAIRNRMLTLLGVERVYDLDRLDLTVKSTLDRKAQQVVTDSLRALLDPDRARAAGLLGPRLLDLPLVDSVIYSFTLYEKANEENVLRVQSDSLDRPFDINNGTKLELGSTAKLRTLITYLEIVADLHDRYAECTEEELRNLELPASDKLSRWAVDHLLHSTGRTLPAMLEAAMDRRYSASPWERFYTGGGLHTFSNFDPEEDSRVPSVREALRDSVNLVFIRLMRDIVHHYMFQDPLSSARILEDAEEPAREIYLARFADSEGRQYLRRFYGKYRGKSRDEIAELLFQGVQPIPSRLVILYLSLNPQAGTEELDAFLRGRLPPSKVSETTASQLHGRYSPAALSLNDRGYLTRIHPLELWMADYLGNHPGATLDQAIDASGAERQEVYRWLFKTKRKRVQDTRIRNLLEIEAFEEIHRSWKRLGYPFDSLVPSYATAIGSSADRPSALTELMGILLNDGMRYPSVQIEALHFAEATPYETLLRRQEKAAERVLAPEIASVVRSALLEVVEKGTARRLNTSTLLGPDGTPVPVGGKTGTGDNRFETHGPGGRLIESRVTGRTATFVFFLGDRFFGAVTVYAPGPKAERHGFTSSLPVQVLKVLLPELMPLITGQETALPPGNPGQGRGLQAIRGAESKDAGVYAPSPTSRFAQAS